MTLGFKPQFVSLILAGTKIHTIREDRGKRWEPGKIIHMATGVRTKAYKQFRQEKCISVQEIKIEYIDGNVSIDGVYLSPMEITCLGINDGFFGAADLLLWFKKDFHGRIIHWTNIKY